MVISIDLFINKFFLSIKINELDNLDFDGFFKSNKIVFATNIYNLYNKLFIKYWNIDLKRQIHVNIK